jgi:Cell cycle and development regulator
MQISCRDEQYRVLWSELETYIRANCHSENHRKVLSCLLECRNKPDVPKSKSKDDKVELDQALIELDE